MSWPRTRYVTVLGALLMALVACGGGDGGSSPSTADGGSSSGTTAVEPGGDGAAAAATDDAGTDSGSSQAGEMSATITVDGEAQEYAVDDVVFSNVEGMSDVTFERCNPDFFGSGRFYAIGYAVDGTGEVIVGEDGGPAGTFTMDLPPDDWEATQRDAPEFEIQINDLDIRIATPEEAAGGTMSWTVDDSTASGQAVFVDFDSTYVVEFELVCAGSPTVDAGDLPADDGDSDDGGGGGFPLGGAGVGSFTADGDSFDGVDVYSCEPFSFGSDPDPRDLSLLAYLGGSSGLEVEISHSQGFDLSDGSEFEQINLNVFHSRQGDGGLEQFEGGAVNDASGDWFTQDPDTFEQIPLAEPPVVITGDNVTGALAGLVQTWPDEGAATVDVTFDLEVPTEVNEEC